MVFGDVQPFFPSEIFENAAAQRAEIARDDEVVCVRLFARRTEVGQNGIRRRRRHCRAHVVHVRHAEIHHLPKRCRGDADPLALRRDERRARARDRPLRLRRAGRAEFERIAVLPFGGSEVTSRRRDDVAAIPRVDERRRHRKALRHRRTGAVHAEKWHGEVARGKARGNDLIEKIARDDHIHLIASEFCVRDRAVDGVRKHFALRLFVRAFAEHIVRKRRLHISADDALAFLRPRHRACGDNARLAFKNYSLPVHCLQFA